MPFDFSPYGAILLDLAGTIYHEDHPLPGAIELIHRFRREGRRFACCTNSTQSPQRVVQRLKSMGVGLELDDVYTAAAAAADYAMQRFGAARRPRLYNLATQGLHALLNDRVDWVEWETSTDRAEGTLPAQVEPPPCDAVIVGTPVGEFVSEPRMRQALTLLRRGAACIGICADRVYPSPRGIEFGSGALTGMLAYAGAVEAVFCGKPDPKFFREMCRRLAATPERCLLIGDNLESDISGAKGVGMATILTLTGVARQADVDRLAAERRPDWVVATLRDLM